MGYLKEFQTQLAMRDFTKFLQLWEEYCTCDVAETEEILELLKLVKESDFAKLLGPRVESLLPLWETIKSDDERYKVLSLIIDLQNTNSKLLAGLALDALKSKYNDLNDFNEKLRLVGLRTNENFQGALANFDLLNHIQKGNFVLHPSGWGVGEIMDFSPIREQMTVEFENVTGLKHVTFSNAFKTLIPLSSEHFLARRFANPDKFEKEARENPIEIIKILLRDLGPKTASEIKDELCELVIPEADWQKWWQNARTKLKKDTEIESPENLKDSFKLRKQAVSHEVKILETLQKKQTAPELLLTCYNFIRDYPAQAKLPEVKQALKESLEGILKKHEFNPNLALQVYYCLDFIKEQKSDQEIKKIIQAAADLEELIDDIEIIAFKKQVLITVKAYRTDWIKQYLILLPKLTQGMLRDFIFKELNQPPQRNELNQLIDEMTKQPEKNPDFMVWYFNKVITDKDETLPYGDKEGQCQLAESYLMLLNRIENIPSYKELVKKMYVALSHKRYALVRYLFEGSTFNFVKEFLLLSTKCHTFTDSDLKILKSLAEVVHPSLGDGEKKKRHHGDLIWTTEAGYLKIQERVKNIGTKEIVDNAREIEAARALGDLRENSEYKYALEKRSNLQRELKRLSEELRKARILSPEDVTTDEISVGSVIIAEDPTGVKKIFKILGPWEADPDNYILSFQSKVAQSMLGSKVDDIIKFKDEDYRILKLSTIFEAPK